MKVVVCGQEFDVVSIPTVVSDTITKINFEVMYEGKVRTLRCEYDKSVVEAFTALSGVNGEDELEKMIQFEFRLELFSAIKGVNLSDITQGKRPDLITEFVKEFGFEYIEAEVQEKYPDLIAEGMSQR